MSTCPYQHIVVAALQLPPGWLRCILDNEIILKSVLDIAWYFIAAGREGGGMMNGWSSEMEQNCCFLVTLLNRWLSKPIKQTLRTNYDSNPLSGIIEMRWVESCPQSCLNNESLFWCNFVFLCSLNVQRSLPSFSLWAGLQGAQQPGSMGCAWLAVSSSSALLCMLLLRGD